MTSVRQQCLSQAMSTWDIREGVGGGWWLATHPCLLQGKFRASSCTTLVAQLLPQPRFGEGSGYWASHPGHCYPLPATCLSLMFTFFIFIVPILNSCPHENPFRGQGSELKH